MVDYHGICKPTGLQRTYPNVINYEGVHGLENMKWVASTYDMPLYDVTIPLSVWLPVRWIIHRAPCAMRSVKIMLRSIPNR